MKLTYHFKGNETSLRFYKSRDETYNKVFENLIKYNLNGPVREVPDGIHENPHGEHHLIKQCTKIMDHFTVIPGLIRQPQTYSIDWTKAHGRPPNGSDSWSIYMACYNFPTSQRRRDLRNIHGVRIAGLVTYNEEIDDCIFKENSDGIFVMV